MDGDLDALAARAAGDLSLLTAYPDRHVGGDGNRAATRMFADRLRQLGFDVSVRELPCFEWVPEAASLHVRGTVAPLEVGPYSPSCDLEAPLVAVSDIEHLESESVRGAIALLHGEIAAHQVMPRNFTFYNPESHRRIYRALDAFAPVAIVAATGRDPEMVGSQYPFPLFEDGDLDVPNAFTTDAHGAALLPLAGERVRLRIESGRIPAAAEHVVARSAGAPASAERVVLSAHIDSRRGSPGALDNATGVATLLALGSLLAASPVGLPVEFVPFNGEDDYANPGELAWIAENEGNFDRIALGINIDDSSQRGARNQVSFYGCPPHIEEAVRRLMTEYPLVEDGPQWFQGDHGILAMHGRPAIAIASEAMEEFMATRAHTERDTLESADSAAVAQTARFLHSVLRAVGT